MAYIGMLIDAATLAYGFALAGYFLALAASTKPTLNPSTS